MATNKFWRAIRRRRHQRTLLFALAFDNGLDDREAVYRILNGDDSATSYTNLVNIRPIIADIRMRIFAANRRQLADPLSLSTLAFRDGLRDRNSGFCRFDGNNFSTSCRNLMRFSPATPEFIRR